MIQFLARRNNGIAVQDLLISTVAGIAAFVIVFVGSLYALSRRRSSTPAQLDPMPKPNPQPPTLEDTRVELVREARKELSNDPPPAPPVADADMVDVVRDLQRRATSGRATKPNQD